MRINHNLAALNTYRQLSANGANSSKSLEKLSSGLRINRAGDDAAGLAISEKMRGQIRGLDQAARNGQDAISLIQTAEGALSETHSILQRMRELAVQSSNDTNTESDRGEMQKEINQLTSEINRISNTTEFNTMKLLDGSRKASTGTSVKALATGVNAPAYDVNGDLSGMGLSEGTTLEKDTTYQINITRATVKSVGDNQFISTVANDLVDASVAGTDSSLTEGSYRVEIAADTVTAVKGGATTVDTHSLLDTANNNNAITISADSNLDLADAAALGNYAVEITKTTTKTATGSNAAGISNVNVNAFDDGTRFDIAVDTAIDTTAAVTSDANLFNTNNTAGTISNLTIAKNSTYATADQYEIKVVQVGDTKATATTAALTNGVDLSDDTLSIAVNGGGAVVVALNDVQGLGAGYNALTNQPNVVSALQADIDAVFNGTANGGFTFTVAANGNGISITLDQDVIGNNFTLTAAGGNDLGLNALSSNSVTNTTDEVNLRFTLTNNTGSGDAVVETADASFTATSGSQNIKLGDISFDIAGDEVYASDAGSKTDATAGSYSGDTITLDAAIKMDVSVTKDGDTANTVTQTFRQSGADDGAKNFNFGGDNFTMTIAGASLQGGQTQVTTVDVETEFSVQLGKDLNSDGTIDALGDLGTATEFSYDDLVDANTVKNIALGAAGNGVFVDLDVDTLRTMTDNQTWNVEFQIETQGTYTAQIQKADGSTIGATAFVLDKTAGDHAIGLGQGITLDYDGAADLGDGFVYFSVNESDPIYTATLKEQGALVNLESKTFDAGDTIEFDKGVSIDTSLTVQNNDQATFKVVEDTSAITEDKSLKMQIGANTGQSMAVDIRDMKASALAVSATTASTKNVVVDGVTYTASYTSTTAVTNGTNNASVEKALDVMDGTKATAAIKVIDEAIKEVSAERSKLGAFQNRLEHTINNLGTSSENLTAAESRVRDVDMAKEMMEFTKNNILSQAAQAMLAQANQQPQGVLQLLR